VVDLLGMTVEELVCDLQAVVRGDLTLPYLAFIGRESYRMRA
jgi:hypothetical protein